MRIDSQLINFLPPFLTQINFMIPAMRLVIVAANCNSGEAQKVRQTRKLQPSQVGC